MLTNEQARQHYGGSIPDSLIQEDFLYHTPCEVCISKMRGLTKDFVALARRVNEAVPDGRAKMRAFKRLEEAFQWGKTGIVRNHHRGNRE